MPRFQVIVHRGKEIVCVDFSNFITTEKEDLAKNLEEAKAFISAKPPKSVLIITNISGAGFDIEVADAIKEFAAHNTPYIKESVVIGADGYQKVILGTIRKLTGRNFHLASSVEKAMDWLSEQ